jgi:hypothetical protein
MFQVGLNYHDLCLKCSRCDQIAIICIHSIGLIAMMAYCLRGFCWLLQSTALGYPVGLLSRC